MSIKEPENYARRANYVMRCVKEKIPKDKCDFKSDWEAESYDALWKEAEELQEKYGGDWAPFQPLEVE